MTIRRLTKMDREDMKYEGVMRLIEGIVLHVLDRISISNKWIKKDISMKTLLAKRMTLRNMYRWMEGWQWSIWVNLYAEHNNFSSYTIKRRFEEIRKASSKYVNARIKTKKQSENTIREGGDTIKDGQEETKDKN